MRQAMLAPIACAALIGLAGCGSSSSSSSSTQLERHHRPRRPQRTSTSSSSASSVKATTDAPVRLAVANAPVQSGVVQIAYHNIAINPDTLRVKVGTTIKWTNHDSVSTT